jgi:hypothetical protein
MKSRPQTLPTPIKELKQLSRLASRTYISGWIVDLHEYLGDVTESAIDLQSELDDLQDLLRRPSIAGLSPTTREALACTLKKMIGFNDDARKEKDQFDKVGVGWCVERASEYAESIKHINKLIKGKTK